MERGSPPRIGKRPPLNITYSHPEGEVAEFECMEAAVFEGIPWPDFQAIHWSERAKLVAHYRLHERIQSWQSWNATQGN